jgi:hypothetical protein
VTISASPATIVNGGSSTLNWTTTNAATASIDNGVGTVPVNGSVSVSPTATTTYNITATGAGGSASVSVKVTVEAAPPTITSSATPEFIPPGGSSTLAWTTTNATSVSIDQGIGGVDLSGSLVVSPTSETTYMLTAIGPGGTATTSVTVKMLVTHLNSIWNGMKMALAGEDIEAALVYFDDQFKEVFRKQFTDRKGNLAQIAAGMSNLTLADAYEEDARLYITRKEISSIDGLEHDYVYEVIFVKTLDGNWKILHF